MTVVELRKPPTSAEAWCARLNADDVSEADRAAFAAWLNASPENRAEYEMCALTFAISRTLHASPELRASPAAPLKKTRPARRSVLLKAAVAASASFLIGASALVAWQRFNSTYSTDIGEQRTISMDDGSTVQLNSATAMSTDIEHTERRVTLRRGEAFFNVAHDPARPFIVTVGRTEIRVLGTQFNVRVDGEAAQVTVVQGRVNVRNRSDETLEPAATSAVDLLAGQGASVAAARPVVKLEDVDAAKITSWRQSKLYFEREALSKVLAEVNRYTEVPFVISNPSIGDLELTGVFRTGDTDSVAFAIRETYGLGTTRERDRIVIH